LQSAWLLALISAFTFLTAGQLEAQQGGRNNGPLWAGLSITVSGVVIGLLEAGWLSVLIAQAALFIGIGAYRLRER
jgi:hypothetical protein